MSDVHVIVPEGVDDPRRPSGGNVYDRRVIRELGVSGWSVHEHAVPGAWPTPAPLDRKVLDEVIGGLPDGAVVLVDGLVGSTAPEVLVPASRRVRLVVLVHMPLADAPTDGTVAETREREDAVLSAAAAVVTTSAWTRRRLLARHALRPDRVQVAEPGVDAAALAPGTATGGELLCVAAVAPHKGHDVLLAALAKLRDDPSWRCTCVGSLDRDVGFVEGLRMQARRDGIADRVRFTGPLTDVALQRRYAGADVLVLASRGETYAMVATEALAHGIPVVATAVGGLPEALGRDADGVQPGVLVPPDDATALADALSTWLGDVDLRRRLRGAAAERRAALTRWPATAENISRVLTAVA